MTARLVDETPIRDSELRRTLHDEVLQLLEYLSTGGHGQLSEPPQYQHLAREAATTLRELLDGDAAAASGTLDAALQEIIRTALHPNRPTTIRVRRDAQAAALPARQFLPVVGAAREALRNALRHAESTAIELAWRCDSQCLTVIVDDDGCGMDPDVELGFGTTESIIGRMHDAGGTSTIASNRRGGTRVTLRQPLSAVPQDDELLSPEGW
ncbi:MAG: putative signal transduction histidine kinase [Thermoleophilia bacterium]|nr:putative signal transduction histidine kinase [Thermoleophilia bacterium]